MDPVSEMAAREVFEQKGLHVVGWYHSHPTFEPEPSIRDIENQTSYQVIPMFALFVIQCFIVSSFHDRICSAMTFQGSNHLLES